MTRSVRPRAAAVRVAAVRVAAGAGSLLGGWIALDSLRSNLPGDERGAGASFLVLWVLPLLLASVFLGWIAVRSGRPGAARLARGGGLGGAIAGGAALVALVGSPLVIHGDFVSGAVRAALYVPLAAALGIVAGFAGAALRERRRRES